MHALLHVAILTGVILLAARMIRGVRIQSVSAALVVALVFSLLNWVLGFPLKLLVGAVAFIPAILTFGLFFLVVPLVVNVILLWLTDKLLKAFEIADARALWLMALLVSVVNALFHRYL